MALAVEERNFGKSCRLEVAVNFRRIDAQLLHAIRFHF